MIKGDENFLFDNRISQRNIAAGKISNEDWDSYLKNLPDMADSCEDIADIIFGENKEETKVESSSEEA